MVIENDETLWKPDVLGGVVTRDIHKARSSHYVLGHVESRGLVA